MKPKRDVDNKGKNVEVRGEGKITSEKGKAKGRGSLGEAG